MKIKEFISTIEGLAINTRNAYEQTLWQLFNRIEGEEPTKDEIFNFLRRYQVSSLHRHKAAIKAYLEYTHPSQAWPFNRRQFAAPRRHIPRFPSAAVVQDIASAATDEDDRMFVQTLFQLGCRIRELMSIEPDNITPAGVSVITKGGHEYLKITTLDFNSRLQAYAKGKKGKLFSRTYNYYDQTLKRLAAKAGFSHITCHMLRHARAIDLLRKNMKLSDVQQFLGHASIQTTAIYLQVTGGELASELEKVEANHNDGRSPQ